MKLRFDKNSIRLRVKKSDLEKLHQEKFLEEKIYFPDGEFAYRLAIASHLTEISATGTSSCIAVRIPNTIAYEWIGNDEVGVYHTIHFGDRSLDIIIEKDFPCKDNKTEDKSDAFTELAERNDEKHC